MNCSTAEDRSRPAVFRRFRFVVVFGVFACLWRPAHAQLTILGVTSGASFEPGLPDKGSIATAFLTGLNVQGIVAASSMPLPTELAGVRITVGGAPAPLFAVAAGNGFQQINFQVPQETQYSGYTLIPNPPGSLVSAPLTYILVQQAGQQASYTATGRALTPGDFFRIGGTQYGIFQHASDYSVVTPQSPAHAGETLVAYLTGLIPTVPPVGTGQASPSNPPAIVPSFPLQQHVPTKFYVGFGIETLGGEQPSFVGLTPGLAGVYQINFTLPAQLPPGDTQIHLSSITCPSLWNAEAGCVGGASLAVSRRSTSVLLPVK